MRRRMLASIGGVKSWTNPYITDGLVAMWDGEWNAGGGVHDANATVWKDLGRKKNDLSISSNRVIEDYSIYFDKVNCGTNSLSSSSFVSCEAVFEISNSSTVFACPAGITTSNVENTKCLNVTSIGFVLSSSSKGSSTGLGSTDKLGNVRSYAYASWEGPYKPNSLVVNGFSRDIGVVNGRSWFVGRKSFEICPYVYYNGAYYGKGRIFCVRLYDRELEDAEIAANYAIDKARFALP